MGLSSLRGDLDGPCMASSFAGNNFTSKNGIGLTSRTQNCPSVRLVITFSSLWLVMGRATFYTD